jgi:hypothetical protein
MSGGVDLSKAIEHANDFWADPCEDGIVWTQFKAIKIAEEYGRLHLDPKEWGSVFLNYNVTDKLVREGLYFVRWSQGDLASRIQSGFKADDFPDRYFICSWRDAGFDLDLGSNNQKPPHTGLNDCAHFVSECLRHAGVSLPQDVKDVDTLLRLLRNRSDTKTLAWLVNIDQARRIIRANLGTTMFSGAPSILQQGDIIAFGNAKKTQHIHSTLYLGNEQITHHTVVNHRDKPNHQDFDPVTKRNQNWEFESNSTHPLVTIIHFATHGEKPALGSPMVGWWRAVWQGQSFFYHFAADGRVVWMQATVPPRGNTPPAVPPDRRGYWFDNFFDLRICWTHSGSFEVYPVVRPDRKSRLAGTCNDDPIVIEKL